MVAVVLVLLRDSRTAPALERWFVPVAVAALCDVFLTLFAQSRFTDGWYAAGAMSMMAAAIVLIALMGQMTSMCGQLEASASQPRIPAETDELTGLANRRPLLQAGYDLPQYSGDGLHVALVDADHFKQINDAQGHEIGDQVLFALTGRMSDALRHQDVLGRYGGEAFLVLLPDTDIDGALLAVERLRAGVACTPIVTPAGPVSVTVSIGLAPVRRAQDLNASIARADAALYVAKAAGRNQVVLDAAGQCVPEQRMRYDRRARNSLR